MSISSSWQAQGNGVAMSLIGSAFTPVQVSGGPSGSSLDYYIFNSGTIYVWITMAPTSAGAASAALPVSGSSSAPGFALGPGQSKTVRGPAGAFFGGIGSGAGPSIVYITPGEGRS